MSKLDWPIAEYIWPTAGGVDKTWILISPCLDSVYLWWPTQSRARQLLRKLTISSSWLVFEWSSAHCGCLATTGPCVYATQSIDHYGHMFTLNMQLIHSSIHPDKNINNTATVATILAKSFCECAWSLDCDSNIAGDYCHTGLDHHHPRIRANEHNSQNHACHGVRPSPLGTNKSPTEYGNHDTDQHPTWQPRMCQLARNRPTLKLEYGWPSKRTPFWVVVMVAWTH